MAASTFDTFTAAAELRAAGFDENRARAIVATRQSARTERATRADFAGLRTGMYRALSIRGALIIAIVTALRGRCGAPAPSGSASVPSEPAPR